MRGFGAVNVTEVFVDEYPNSLPPDVDNSHCLEVILDCGSLMVGVTVIAVPPSTESPDGNDTLGYMGAGAESPPPPPPPQLVRINADVRMNSVSFFT